MRESGNSGSEPKVALNMRDFIMSSNKTLAKLQNPVPLSHESRLELQIKLLQALQTSLDPQQLLSSFYKHIQPLVAVSSLNLRIKNQETPYKVGRNSIHSCSYGLTADDGYLGELQISRSRRFNEEELMNIELFIGSFVFALRNAIRYQEALTLALLDPLTMLGNRAALDSAIGRELPLAQRHHQDLSVLMIDVDYFKSINDSYGHDKGDQVLREIAKIIQQVCRETDMFFRYGGEEFLVILRNTNIQGAGIIAERLRQQIASTAINVKEGGAIRPTVSIGISSLHHGQKEKAQDLFKRADVALYKAKSSGRNCVMEETAELVS
jgi:diguanylate cyclase (GGDEF)-like protein